MLSSGGQCLTAHTVLDLVCAWHIQEWCKTPSPRARWHSLGQSRARTHMSVQPQTTALPADWKVLPPRERKSTTKHKI